MAPCPPGRRRCAGFTLVEVLVAGAVLALLAALALPAYQSQLNRGRTARAVADIKSIEMAMERFMTDRGRFPDTLAEAGVTLNDPWGRPYRYLNMTGAKVGQVRKDRALHPLNTDYDLYSVGPDGKSATPLTAAISQDDIVRARNGSFVGLAKDF